jgi:hypothetical protein
MQWLRYVMWLVCEYITMEYIRLHLRPPGTEAKQVVLTSIGTQCKDLYVQQKS